MRHTATDITAPISPVTDTTGSNSPAAEALTPIRGFLLEVGSLTFPIYGDATIGWSILRRDIADGTPYRYDTFDELLFALLNFSVVSSGHA